MSTQEVLLSWYDGVKKREVGGEDPISPDLLMPNGKPLREFTRAELREISADLEWLVVFLAWKSR
jgi:hypothetical protein